MLYLILGVYNGKKMHVECNTEHYTKCYNEFTISQNYSSFSWLLSVQLLMFSDQGRHFLLQCRILQCLWEGFKVKYAKKTELKTSRRELHVGDLMWFQVRLLRKSFSTNITSIRLFSCMNVHMIPQVISSAECFWTYWTLKTWTTRTQIQWIQGHHGRDWQLHASTSSSTFCPQRHWHSISAPVQCLQYKIRSTLLKQLNLDPEVSMVIRSYTGKYFTVEKLLYLIFLEIRYVIVMTW
jgi:hypothetical protein